MTDDNPFLHLILTDVLNSPQQRQVNSRARCLLRGSVIHPCGHYYSQLKMGGSRGWESVTILKSLFHSLSFEIAGHAPAIA